MSEDIIFSCESHLGIITLNRQKALNALTLPMINALQKQLLLWEKDKNIHAVIIQASPGRAFCAGGDVRSLYHLKGHQEQLDFFKQEYRLNYYIHHYKKPYIALLNGITMGGGVGISLHGSHTVATEHFSFAMPETSLGFFPDIGASYLLANKVPNKTGLYLGLTGARLTNNEALNLNLITHVSVSDTMADIVKALMDEDLSTKSYEKVSACLNALCSTAPALSPEWKNNINLYFSENSMQSIMLALKEANTAWSSPCYSDLQLKSPLSLCVTFEQISRAKNLSLGDCINMDYALVKHFMQNKDFYEGVRALLVDKDKNPQWQFSDVDQISIEEVSAYFEEEGVVLDFD